MSHHARPDTPSPGRKRPSVEGSHEPRRVHILINAQVSSTVASWRKDTPLPNNPPAPPKFQFWHEFNPTSKQWEPVSPNETTQQPHPSNTSDISLLTWNIDALSKHSHERVTEILSFITDPPSKTDIIFLQEVSQQALTQILSDERIRKSWFSTEHENTTCRQSFTTITLASRTRFAFQQSTSTNPKRFTLGPVWRVAFPSHFGRDVLFCDIFVPSINPSISPTRVRLANVHLDSLPINPSHRPRQVSLVSEFLHCAGRGLVAGDFNPVLDEDALLIMSNGLTDAWTALRPGELGYTWGVDGKERYPPKRMDKVALLGLQPRCIEIFEPQPVAGLCGRENAPVDVDRQPGQTRVAKDVVCSDHHAVFCSFGLGE